MCRVSTVYAHRILVWLDHWIKKKPAENEEKSSSTVGLFIILDNVSSSRSWSPEHWRLVHNQNRSVQTYHSFNHLISNHLKDIILDDIQTINFLPVCLYYDSIQIEITEKASLRFWLRLVSYFSFGHGRMRARASGEAARNEEWLIYFSPYIVFDLQYYSIIIRFWWRHSPFFPLNTVLY